MLALAGIAVGNPDSLVGATAFPEWVIENLGRLEQKSTAKDAEPGAPGPEALEQRRRNRESRLERMSQGMEELERWLADTIRQGLGSLDGQAEQALERFAARMVDAKLGSIGRRMRNWKKLLGRTDWQEQLLAEMADLFLLLRTFQRAEVLSEELTMDLVQIAGLSIKKEEVLQAPPVEGRWTVLGVLEGEEDNLRFRRAWVQDQKSGDFALFLDFAWGDQPFEHHWKLGQQFDGSLVYYPSAYPQRALVRVHEEIKIHAYHLKGLDSLEEMSKQYAIALSRQPWVPRFPVLFENIRPVRDAAGQWLLFDISRKALPLSCANQTGWMLLAISGGHGIDIFGEWDGATFFPMSCLSADRLINLCID
ncbi:MAG: hypothetical protein IPJ40_21970 [Saprospirales bacterium]|nr:hypothetical protein [Saprospirales bacterium]